MMTLANGSLMLAAKVQWSELLELVCAELENAPSPPFVETAAYLIDFNETRDRFLRSEGYLDVLADALSNGDVPSIITGARVWEYLSESDRVKLFPTVVQLALRLKFSRLAQNMVLKMPRSWVMEHVEAQVEPLLMNGDCHDYSLLLRLFQKLDVNLARKLALRAAASEDSDIRDIGNGFLETHGDSSGSY